MLLDFFNDIHCVYVYILFFKDLFERERVCVHAQAGAGRGTSRLPVQHGAHHGTGPHDPETTTRAKTKSWTFN